MSSPTMQIIAAILFALALVHTFTAKYFEILARRSPRHAGLFHLLGEVEVVFGLWAFILITLMACLVGGNEAISYAESRQYTEPMFVFVVMVIAASHPVIDFVRRCVTTLAGLMPLRTSVAQVWLGLGLLPLLGSLITEPAAMTLAALMLAPQIFRKSIPERLKYAALGVLFVNISIGGTLTSYAAPPVLMVAHTWGWDSWFMFTHIGWKAALAVLINASVITFLLRSHIDDYQHQENNPVPLGVSLIHIGFLAMVVVLAHHPVLFVGLFLFFFGFAHAYGKYQTPLIVQEGLMVGFFLVGLVVLGGAQQWWLQPLVSSLKPGAIFAGSVALTAITDNAALTYLGSQIQGLSEQAKILLVSGAVAGGGLTVIANAPNPAGVALLRVGFKDESIGAVELLIGAALPTLLASLLFMFNVL